MLVLRTEKGSPLTAEEADGNFIFLKNKILDSFGNMSSNENGTGYCSFGNGLILQWGTFNTQTGKGDKVDFNIEFPNRAFGIWIKEAYSGGWKNNETTGDALAPTLYAPSNIAKSYFKVYGCRVVGNSSYPQAELGLGGIWFAIGN